MTGAYQKIAVTHQSSATKIPPKTASGRNMKPADMPAIESFAAPPPATTSCAMIAPATATSGITKSATAYFESTVSTSDSGIDFQNNTERSRRSAYSASSE